MSAPRVHASDSVDVKKPGRALCDHRVVAHVVPVDQVTCKRCLGWVGPQARREASAKARAIAETPAAQELARRSGGRHGTWTKDDEERLYKGLVKTPAGDVRLPLTRVS